MEGGPSVGEQGQWVVESKDGVARERERKKESLRDEGGGGGDGGGVVMAVMVVVWEEGVERGRRRDKWERKKKLAFKFWALILKTDFSFVSKKWNTMFH